MCYYFLSIQNISDITSRDTLENYLARILDVDVKEVHYPANVNGCCIAVFYRPIRGSVSDVFYVCINIVRHSIY